MDISHAQNATTEEKRRDAIAVMVDTALQRGDFTYTEALLLPEPFRSHVFEHLDGVRLQGGVPQYGAAQVYEMPPVRLLAVNPRHDIQYSEWHQTRIPGTQQQAPREKRIVKLGSDATVRDMPGERLPRRILRQHGWPNRNVASNGNNIGTVVEWRWLELAVNSPDATDEIRELHAALKARIDAKDGTADTKPTTRSKSAPPTQAQL